MSKYLVGYKFGIIWDGEDGISNYEIVDGKGKLTNGLVGIDTDFAKSLMGRNEGDKVEFVVGNIRNKYTIKQISCPSVFEVCKIRKITKLIHFTPIENLNSILNYGLLSVNLLKSKNIRYNYNDKERIDRHLDYISCSIEFPNGSMLNYCLNFHKYHYAILEIDIDVLNHKFAKCCSVNAARANGYYIESIDKFNYLFEGDRSDALPDNFPTDEQAEVLIKDNIEPKYIKNIVFQNEEDMSLFKSLPNVRIDKELFKYRDDYIYCYKKLIYRSN